MTVKTPKFCEYCGKKLVKEASNIFNIYTGKKKNILTCPEIIKLRAEFIKIIKTAKKFESEPAYPDDDLENLLFISAKMKPHTCL